MRQNSYSLTIFQNDFAQNSYSLTIFQNDFAQNSVFFTNFLKRLGAKFRILYQFFKTTWRKISYSLTIFQNDFAQKFAFFNNFSNDLRRSFVFLPIFNAGVQHKDFLVAAFIKSLTGINKQCSLSNIFFCIFSFFVRVYHTFIDKNNPYGQKQQRVNDQRIAESYFYSYHVSYHRRKYG